jgi:radical SAM protein with 4Fe4S-binding SPASM domain
MEIEQTPKRRVTSAPVMVQILLTRKCNLSCSYCGAERFNEIEKDKELSTKEWSDVLKRLKEIRVFKLELSGGEMFLREDLFEILETAVKYKFPVINITTNGTLISEKIARQLNRLNFAGKNISISLDGNEESNDKLRGRGSYEKTIKGIKNLINNGIIPGILFSPLKYNYKALGDMVERIYDMGIRSISFNAIHPSGRCSKTYKDLLLDWFVEAGEFQEMVKGIREKYNGIRINDPPFVYKSYPVQYHYIKISSEKTKNIPRLKPCSAAHSSCNITSGGWVVPCSELYDFKGGNIREKDILDIWRYSENFAKIRNLSDISSDQIPWCRNCDYNCFCNSGCRADAHIIYGDIMAPDPFCPYWKKD